MAFVAASALSVALFKLSFASCKEVTAFLSSDFAQVPGLLHNSVDKNVKLSLY